MMHVDDAVVRKHTHQKKGLVFLHHALWSTLAALLSRDVIFHLPSPQYMYVVRRMYLNWHHYPQNQKNNQKEWCFNTIVVAASVAYLHIAHTKRFFFSKIMAGVGTSGTPFLICHVTRHTCSNPIKNINIPTRANRSL